MNRHRPDFNREPPAKFYCYATAIAFVWYKRRLRVNIDMNYAWFMRVNIDVKCAWFKTRRSRTYIFIPRTVVRGSIEIIVTWCLAILIRRRLVGVNWKIQESVDLFQLPVQSMPGYPQFACWWTCIAPEVECRSTFSLDQHCGCYTIGVVFSVSYSDLLTYGNLKSIGGRGEW